MNAPVFDIKRFAVHDGDGIRTTVFFSGCPLRCVWCHNPEGLEPHARLAYFAHKCTHCGACTAACPTGAQKSTADGHRFLRTSCTLCRACVDVCPSGALRVYGRAMTVEELLPLLLEDRAFYETSGGGVTLSGGECLLYPDFCADLLRALKAEGIHTAVDTCGAVPWSYFERVLPYTDVFLYDVKAVDEEVHRRCTGASNRQILENLQRLASLNLPVEIRVPFVPAWNDTEMDAIAALLSPMKNLRRVRVLAYHSYAADKYDALGLCNTLPTVLPTEDELAQARKLLERETL